MQDTDRRRSRGYKGLVHHPLFKMKQDEVPISQLDLQLTEVSLYWANEIENCRELLDVFHSN